MKIHKVINNNVVSAFDDKNLEVVVMGRGIGFKAHSGDLINEEKIEKIFRIKNAGLSNRFTAVLETMPLEHIQLAMEIISYAMKKLGLEFNQGIYVTLTDHIDFAIHRYKNGIKLSNALLWEIKQYYEREFLLGKYAVELINKRIGISFTDDEAGFIALHFVNAEYDANLKDTYAAAGMLQEILTLIGEKMQGEPNKKSLHYERFLTHLKFLTQRIFSRQLLMDEERELSDMLKNSYPKEYECSLQIAKFLKTKYSVILSEEEIVFLCVHIKRIYTNNKKE